MKVTELDGWEEICFLMTKSSDSLFFPRDSDFLHSGFGIRRVTFTSVPRVLGPAPVLGENNEYLTYISASIVSFYNKKQKDGR